MGCLSGVQGTWPSGRSPSLFVLRRERAAFRTPSRVVLSFSFISFGEGRSTGWPQIPMPKLWWEGAHSFYWLLFTLLRRRMARHALRQRWVWDGMCEGSDGRQGLGPGTFLPDNRVWYTPCFARLPAPSLLLWSYGTSQARSLVTQTYCTALRTSMEVDPINLLSLA